MSVTNNILNTSTCYAKKDIKVKTEQLGKKVKKVTLSGKQERLYNMEVLAKEAKTQSWKYSCSTKLNARDLKELNDGILATNNKTVFWPQTAFELKKPENDSSLT